MQEKNANVDNNEDKVEPPGEIMFAVEAGSPADKVLQVLKNKGFDAEVTGIEVKGGRPGKHQLVKVEGVLSDGRAGSSFTIWAILLPSGMAYLLSAQGPGEHGIPVLPRIYQLLLEGEGKGAPDHDQETGGDAP